MKKGTAPEMEHSMAILLLLSIFCASANTLLWKATLNAFSSPTTNFGFFVSQFSTAIYVVQALVVSLLIVLRSPATLKEVFLIPTSVYFYMGLLDSGSSTLGAIAGANCRGGVQTILNQMQIPITLVGARFFLESSFEVYQIWGSAFILVGALVASSNYLFGISVSDDSPIDSNRTSIIGAAIVLYLISVIPSAFSNIYKEYKMKEQDMNEIHTSTLVSFWQVLIGFLFVPLLALPSLGGLDRSEIESQLSDGYQCFRHGINPLDTESTGCQHGASLLMVYILVNFIYNLMLLYITKHGSAVLLVVSQALSLPVTNIAFSLHVFMGNEAEPLTAADLLGLVMACIGFLLYSGFGLASNFMVAQGPPGQMAYAAFGDGGFGGAEKVIVSTDIATQPDELSTFLVGSILQQFRQEVERAERQVRIRKKHNYYWPLESIAEDGEVDSETASTPVSVSATKAKRSINRGDSDASTDDVGLDVESSSRDGSIGSIEGIGGIDSIEGIGGIETGVATSSVSGSGSGSLEESVVTLPDASPLGACIAALDVAKRLVEILEAQLKVLQQEGGEGPTGRELMRRMSEMSMRSAPSSPQITASPLYASIRSDQRMGGSGGVYGDGVYGEEEKIALLKTYSAARPRTYTE